MGNSARIPVARLGTAALRRVTLPAAGLWKKSGGVLPPDPVEAIMQACVLWYDISKQQATNEGMAANPVLRDLSGNGHDATCYNFAWSGMSGIGGYAYDFTTFNQTQLSNCTPTSFDLTNNKSDYGGTYTTDAWFKDKFTIKVSNFSGDSDLLIRYYYLDESGVIHMSGNIKTIQSNGDYEIDGSLYPEAFGIVMQFPGIGSCTIEQLPLYPNALVSDGVDDYIAVSGLPTVTPEKGFTVIFDSMLGTTENSRWFRYFQRGKAPNTSDLSFFTFYSLYGYFSYNIFAIATNSPKIPSEYVNIDGVNIFSSKRFNNLSIGPTGSLYNADDFLYIAAGYYQKVRDYANMALRKFILFDRDLTDNEIEWVKKNMIEGEGVMKYDWLSSSWVSYIGGTRGTGTVTSYRFTIKAIRSDARVLETTPILPSIESYKIQVLNLPEGVKMIYSGVLNNRETDILTISRDGIYELPPINVESRFIGFRFNKTFENENVIIQQLLS